MQYSTLIQTVVRLLLFAFNLRKGDVALLNYDNMRKFELPTCYMYFNLREEGELLY